MPYCTVSDIQERIPSGVLAQLTDDTNGAVVSSSIVSACIEEADANIDLYLRGKHTVPLSTVPKDVKRWSVRLAIYFLYSRRLDTDMPESVLNDYRLVVGQLKEVRDNDVLIDDVSSVANTAGHYKASSTSSTRIFTTNDQRTGYLDHFSSGLI